MGKFLVPRRGYSTRNLTDFYIHNSLGPRSTSLSRVPHRWQNPEGRKLVTWYTCGPTVYDSAHVGHACCYIRLDLMRRSLERLGEYKVVQVMNITDIDDKIIKKANQTGKTWDIVSRMHEREFLQELDMLNVKKPELIARVTDFMVEIVDFINKLVLKGFAYPTSDGSVWFDSKAYGDTTVFVRSNTTDESATEQEGHKLKKHSSDFCLWKGHKPDEPFWDSPWGKGRPGWHTECSAIAAKFFGNVLNVHAGGCDLIFPHHQNEEIQCRAFFSNKDKLAAQWVQQWIHTGHVTMKEEKMSKSLGNTVTIRDFLNNYSADVIRMLCFSAPYRTDLSYTDSELAGAKSQVDKIAEFLHKCDLLCKGHLQQPIVVPTTSTDSYTDLWEDCKTLSTTVDANLRNDFDFPAAKHGVFEFVRKFNKLGFESASQPLDYSAVLFSKTFLSDFLTSLGFQLQPKTSVSSTESSIDLQSIFTEFTEFRNTVRNFALVYDESDKVKQKAIRQERALLMKSCDSVRLKLKEFGLNIKDHKNKSSWELDS